ncbi:MAG: TlpA family protein disulfide reductase [Terriglobia bacterium]
MSKKNQIIATIIVIVIVVAAGYFANRFWIVPSIAQRKNVHIIQLATAPNFTVHPLGGDDLSLTDFRGKVVLLNFWATWCGPCRDETPSFVEMQRKYGSKGFQIIGIAVESSPDSIKSFYNKFHMNYPVAPGDAKLAALYGGLYGTPTSFLIGRDGRIYDEVPGEVDQARWEQEIQELLPQSPDAPDRNFQPAGESAQVAVQTPAEVNSEIPGLDLSHLTKQQVAQLKETLSGKTCPCGCKLSLLQCRVTDSLCSDSRGMAKAELAKLQRSNPKI